MKSPKLRADTPEQVEALRAAALHAFEYRDGVLYWKNPASSRIEIGREIGTKDSKGYLSVRLGYTHHRVHRLIFLMHNGYLPEFIDHIDGDKLNNRIENLRAATKSQNSQNTGMISNNTSGVRNVSWCRPRKKWVVAMKFYGKNRYIGAFEDLELAELVAYEARDKFFGAFGNRGELGCPAN